MTAVTAVTAQDTTGVAMLQLMPPELVRAQIRACLEDIGADAIKIGMLGSGDIAAVVAEALHEFAAAIPIVLDTVLVSTAARRFSTRRAKRCCATGSCRRGDRYPQPSRSIKVTGIDAARDPEAAGLALLANGAKAALVKGGHGFGDMLVDTLVWPEGSALSRICASTPCTPMERAACWPALSRSISRKGAV